MSRLFNGWLLAPVALVVFAAGLLYYGVQGFSQLYRDLALCWNKEVS
jgi:hypothetical protein